MTPRDLINRFLAWWRSSAPARLSSDVEKKIMADTQDAEAAVANMVTAYEAKTAAAVAAARKEVQTELDQVRADLAAAHAAHSALVAKIVAATPAVEEPAGEGESAPAEGETAAEGETVEQPAEGATEEAPADPGAEQPA